MVAALKDPYGGNLDRIRVVKGWVESSGKTYEKIFDVAWSQPNKREPRGRRQAFESRQHGGRRECDLDQHDRCAGTRYRLDGS